MHKQESVQEHETHKILGDFKTQTDPLISATRGLYQVLINNKNNNKKREFAPVKTKGIEKINKYLDLVRELQKLWKIRVTVIPIVVDSLGTVPKSFEKCLDGYWHNRNHPDYIIA